jgi:general secretion pathway protein G
MKRGFTLVELLIVIAILAILSTLGINNFMTARIKARDISRKSDLSTIAKSLEAYVNDKRAYPAATSLSWGDPFTDSTVTPPTVYAAKLPSDPGGYNYYYVKSGAGYTLYAHLENTEDPTIYAPATDGCGGTVPSCNYKITSSNL